MISITYIVHFLVYAWLMLFGLAPFALLIFALPESVAQGPVGWILLAAGLAYMSASTWVAHTAARRRVLEGEGFLAAWSGAIEEVRWQLGLLPVIGRLFAGPDRASHSPFDAGAESEERFL